MVFILKVLSTVTISLIVASSFNGCAGIVEQTPEEQAQCIKEFCYESYKIDRSNVNMLSEEGQIALITRKAAYRSPLISEISYPSVEVIKAFLNDTQHFQNDFTILGRLISNANKSNPSALEDKDIQLALLKHEKGEYFYKRILKGKLLKDKDVKQALRELNKRTR